MFSNVHHSLLVLRKWLIAPKEILPDICLAKVFQLYYTQCGLLERNSEERLAEYFQNMYTCPNKQDSQ